MQNDNPRPVQPGQKVGRLTILRSHFLRDRQHRNRKYWVCQCDCDNEKTIEHSNLASGRTRSCGCLNKEKAHTHANTILRRAVTKTGQSDSAAYRAWAQMKQRCNNPTNPNYQRYGGRGIKVCPRWLEFENFYCDMGDAPEGLSLDRIDNDGDYEPGNCRWATAKQQNRNARFNTIITHQGVARPLAEWAEIIGISQITLSSRLQRGWSIARALSTPKQGYVRQ